MRLKRGSSIVRLSSALESWGHRSWQCICGYFFFLKYLFLCGLAFHTYKQTVTKNRALENTLRGWRLSENSPVLLACPFCLTSSCVLATLSPMQQWVNGKKKNIIVRVLTSRAGLFMCVDEYTFPLPLYQGGKVTNGVFLHFINFIFLHSLHSNRSLMLRACIAPSWFGMRLAWPDSLHTLLPVYFKLPSVRTRMFS